MCYNGQMDNCIFCKIISRQVPGYIIAENDNVIVFVSRHNDPLVVPKKHIKDIYELDNEIGSEIMGELIKTAKAVKKGLESMACISRKLMSQPQDKMFFISIFMSIHVGKTKRKIK